MKLLGISNLEPYSCYSHDTSVALIENTKILGAVAEERFTKIKHYAGYPACSLDWMSKNFDIEMDEICIAIPWAESKTFPMPIITNNNWPLLSINQMLKRGKVPTKVIRIDHQKAHAAAAYRTSGWKDCIVISLDGGGSDSDGPTSGGIFVGKDYELTKISSLDLENNLGNFYGAVTEALGWSYGDGEGKTMGLAAYGNYKYVYDKLEKIAPKVSSLRLIQGSFIPPTFEVVNGRFCVEFNNEKFSHIKKLIQYYGRENVAAAAQEIIENRIVELVQNSINMFGIKKVCLSGGVFLNVKAIMKIRESINNIDIYIPSNPGDGGLALGAALEAYFGSTGKSPDEMIITAFFGPKFSNEQIEAELKLHSNQIIYHQSGDIAGETAGLIAKKKVVGWFQGKAEWGARALGSRSVLADPSDLEVKDRLNNILKMRESFMPFAPSIKEEAMDEYLLDCTISPFMQLAFDVPVEKKKEMSGVLHVDGTTRAQTVNKNSNQLYYNLISEYEKESGLPLVLNTSFNRHGLPIVNSPADAIQHLLWGCVDVLAIGDYIVMKKNYK